MGQVVSRRSVVRTAVWGAPAVSLAAAAPAYATSQTCADDARTVVGTIDFSAAPSSGGRTSLTHQWTSAGVGAALTLTASSTARGVMTSDPWGNLRRSASATERLYIAQSRTVPSAGDSIVEVEDSYAAGTQTSFTLQAPAGWTISRITVRVTDLDASARACDDPAHQPDGKSGVQAHDYIDAVRITGAKAGSIARGANLVEEVRDGQAYVTTSHRSTVLDHTDLQASFTFDVDGAPAAQRSFGVDYWNLASALHSGNVHPTDTFQIIGLVFTVELSETC